MKKINGFLAVMFLLVMGACSNNKPAEVRKEVIIVPVTPVTVPEKSTTIIVDKNGVKVGTKKVDVTINPPKKKQ